MIIGPRMLVFFQLKLGNLEKSNEEIDGTTRLEDQNKAEEEK
jgi:hypothetical protein